MQTPEEFVECIRAAEVVDGKYVKHFYTFNESLNLIRARDAEWQARVNTLLEDNARSEEQVKKQFATAVSFKARAEKAEARGDKLEAALEEVVATYPAEDAMRAAATEALRKAGEI